MLIRRVYIPGSTLISSSPSLVCGCSDSAGIIKMCSAHIVLPAVTILTLSPRAAGSTRINLWNQKPAN